MVVLEMPVGVWIAFIILGLAIGVVAGFFVRKLTHEKSVDAAKNEADKIVAEAEALAEKTKKESINEAKKEIQELKQEAEADIKERKSVVVE